MELVQDVMRGAHRELVYVSKEVWNEGMEVAVTSSPDQTEWFYTVQIQSDGIPSVLVEWFSYEPNGPSEYHTPEEALAAAIDEAKVRQGEL
jgi:hypothetical protein